MHNAHKHAHSHAHTIASPFKLAYSVWLGIKTQDTNVKEVSKLTRSVPYTDIQT